MKKALSLILALILALTMALPAFAADNEIKLGKPEIISVKDGEQLKVTFTPEKDGFYAYTYELLEGDEGIAPFFSFGFAYFAFRSDKKGEEIIFEESTDTRIFLGEKGEKYTITFDGCFGAFKIKAVISEYSCADLKEGKNIVKFGKNENRVDFGFIPPKDGYYNFTSDCNKDTYLGIVGGDGLSIYSDEIGYKNDHNFDYTVLLEAGRLYFVDVGVYRNFFDKGAFDCSVNVTYGQTKKAEGIRLDGLHYYAKNSIDKVYLNVIPSGAAATADVKVSSGSNEIITVDDLDLENGEILISSYDKTGKAVITVTADSVTEEFKIKVCNDFEWFFVKLFRDIKDFFQRTFNF